MEIRKKTRLDVLTDFLPPWLSNRYVIITMLFVALICFLDPHNSLISQYDNKLSLKRWKEKQAHHQKIIDDINEMYILMKGDDKQVEKFARTLYPFKRKDEEIFIIVEKDEYEEIRRKSPSIQ